MQRKLSGFESTHLEKNNIWATLHRRDQHASSCPPKKNYQKEREKNEWSYEEMRTEMGEGGEKIAREMGTIDTEITGKEEEKAGKIDVP
jgi:hypothetical protein